MKKRVVTFVLTAVLSIVSWTVYAADGYFDTEAAKHTEQGIAFLKAKNYDAAIKEFEESASIYPDAEAYYYLGYAYYMKGRGGDGESRKKSMENFEKSYELDPNFSPTGYKSAELAPDKTQQPEPDAATQPAAQSQPSRTAEPTQPAHSANQSK